MSLKASKKGLKSFAQVEFTMPVEEPTTVITPTLVEEPAITIEAPPIITEVSDVVPATPVVEEVDAPAPEAPKVPATEAPATITEPTPPAAELPEVVVLPSIITDQRVIGLLYTVILGEYNQARLYLDELIKADPNFIHNPTIMEALAQHIDLSFLITTNTLPGANNLPGSNLNTPNNPTSARQNPSEAVIGWFLEQKFAVGRAANTIIRRFFKLQISQPIPTTNTARCTNSDKIVTFNSLFHNVIQKTKLEDIDESLFVELYEYAPIVLEKLINLGLDVSRSIKGGLAGQQERPIAWHIMRIAARPAIIYARNEMHAMCLYKCLKNSGTFKPLPMYFEGCQDHDIITDLCTKPEFLEGLKHTIGIFNDRYLIETINDDRITNILHLRGCPDPSKGLFDELILDRVTAITTAMTHNRANLHQRNSQDLNLLGFSLYRGPYTQAHLTCLQRIAAEMGPTGFNRQISQGIDDARRVGWFALHIAFYRFDLEAWDRRRKIEEVEVQTRQGILRPDQSQQQLQLTRDKITEMHDNRGGYQVQIIEWLYSLFPQHESFGHDRHSRTPLMCLPIDNTWIDDKKGVDRASPIIDHFVKLEVRCLSLILKKPVNETSYRQRLISWRLSELKNRETAFTMRQMHAAGTIIDRIFGDLKPQTGS